MTIFFPLRTSKRVKWRGVLLFTMALLPLGILALAMYDALGGEAGNSDPISASRDTDLVGTFLLGVAVLLSCCLLAGGLATRLGQPRVLGEIAAGLLLGPSFLGALSPRLSEWLFPPSILPMMEGLAQLGLVLFMFGVGRELSTIRLRGMTSQALFVSYASLVIPLAMGSAAALLLVDAFVPPGVHPVTFVLFIGCAISITAFPVLAKIVAETGLARTLPGRLSLIAAALGDGGSWILLGVIVAVAHGTGAVAVLAGALVAAGLIAALLSPLRTAVERWGSRALDSVDQNALPVLAIVVVCAAALTSALGIHQLIGALVVGILWPSGHEVADRAARLAAGVCPLLLPFFFFGFGLTIDLTSFSAGSGALPVLALLFAVSVLTKVVGVAVAARLTQVHWRDSITLGVLVNTRGLTELIVVHIGYDAGIIGVELLAVLILNALATTFMTGPLLRVIGDRDASSSRHEAG